MINATETVDGAGPTPPISSRGMAFGCPMWTKARETLSSACTVSLLRATCIGISSHGWLLTIESIWGQTRYLRSANPRLIESDPIFYEVLALDKCLR